MAGTSSKSAPDPVAWMQEHMGHAGPSGGSGQPVSASGSDKPTQHDGAKVGFKNVNSHGKAEHGRKEPSSKFRGNGQKKSELAPNNKKHAGSSTKGKPAFGMPTRNAIARRLNKPVGQSQAPSAQNARGRTGQLKNFEGFNKNNG